MTEIKIVIENNYISLIFEGGGITIPFTKENIKFITDYLMNDLITRL